MIFSHSLQSLFLFDLWLNEPTLFIFMCEMSTNGLEFVLSLNRKGMDTDKKGMGFEAVRMSVKKERERG